MVYIDLAAGKKRIPVCLIGYTAKILKKENAR